MVKTYELMERHFGWTRAPKGATARETVDYLLDRALRSQGLISGPSAMYPKLRFTPVMQARIDGRVRRRELVPVAIEGETSPHYATPQALDEIPAEREPLVHILSPFDPLVIQRRRLKLFFGYDHLFEAYVPKAKRQFGYFVLPVLVGDAIVAALDLKADRAARRLLIQSWHWLDGSQPRSHKRLIEAALDRFAAFQFGD
jgi:hypothetical protein